MFSTEDEELLLDGAFIFLPLQAAPENTMCFFWEWARNGDWQSSQQQAIN